MVITIDLGLGTTYERWALNRALVQLSIEEKIRSVFEGPGDGISGIVGINSLPFALRGAECTVMLDNKEQIAFARQIWKKYAPKSNPEIIEIFDNEILPFPENTFDLVWNFNVMSRKAESIGLLGELCRISRRNVLIVVPNRANYSFMFHRLQHKVSGKPWDHGTIDLMHPNSWKKRLTLNRMIIKRVFYVDCPWWPDIVDMHEFITDFFPFLDRFSTGLKPEQRMKWDSDHLPYYYPQENLNVHMQMEKLASFEKLHCIPINRFFGHHVAILAEKPKVGQ